MIKNKVTVFEKSTCNKCRETMRLLTEAGIDFETVEYHSQQLSAKKLRDLAQKLGKPLTLLLRTNEAVYRELGIADTKLSDGELSEIMVTYPDLIQRPIIEFGALAVIGRPPTNVETIITEYKKVTYAKSN